ncbi:hypothetical protein [Escherichia coli]|uniref:Phage protein n=1 Tax=Escherichia coli TaxID=562 RepID=A0ABD5CB39_ECOLX|nr:hypothetical protein [Escherichia coli]MDR5971483.1 hypothetical protein [Escherichia coli]MDR6024595.1 hypothetical protein [Escherichia coli]MDR6049083.1 hypothetical protein [Escherichia coli]MDR6057295.1 hypothetical protein [Escherichia coli]
MNSGTLAMYEKDYENYFNSLKKGDEVLSLNEYIECMGGFKGEKEDKEDKEEKNK